MDSKPSSDEAASHGLDLNSAAAAAAVHHQEPSTEAAASEPAAGPLDGTDSSCGTTAETLGKPPDVSVDSGNGCSTELGSKDSAPAVVVGGVGVGGSEGVPESGGIGAEVVETSNRSGLVGEGVSSTEKDQSSENGAVDGHMGWNQEVIAAEFTAGKGDASERVTSGLNQGMDSKAMGGGSKDSNLVGKGDVVALEPEVTADAPVVEAASDGDGAHLVSADGVDGGDLVTPDVCLEADGVSQRDSQVDANEVHMGEQEPLERAEKETVERATVEPRTSVMENDLWARYHLPHLEDQTAYSVPNLVWGKVRSYPWWPGEIFDPSDASEMALKLQKEDKFLIAYFGDKTFAWNEESQLKPFYKYFSKMAKQSHLESFTTAVNAALEEVTRRVELGMNCSCFANEACANMKYRKVENAGIHEGTHNSAVDRTLILNSFQPDRLLDYIEALTLFPSGGADRLELAIATAQLKAFYRSKGYPELPVFFIGGGLMENVSDDSPYEIKKPGKDIADGSASNPAKRKSRGTESSSSKRKRVSEDGRKRKRLSDLLEEEEVPRLANDDRNGSRRKTVVRSPSKKPKVLGSDSPGVGKTKKKSLESLGDIEAKTPSPRSAKVGERIRRAASQLTGSPSILKPNEETKSVAKAKRRRGDAVPVVVDRTTHTHSETSRIRKGASKVYSSPSELLSQLRLVARDPMKGYSFFPDIISFFTEFWASHTSSFSEDKDHVDSVGGKRGRKKSTEKVMPDYTQDSYWSDVIFRNSPEELASSGRKRKGKSRSQRRKKKMKPSGEEPSLSPPSDTRLDTIENLQVSSAGPCTEQEPTDERPMNNSGERIGGESRTALILGFTKSDVVPSETDLISTFSRYGPLEEAETEVVKSTSCAKVVFRNFADAEAAYSSARTSSIFGPALVSYRLSHLPSTPKASPDTKKHEKTGASPIVGDNRKLPGTGAVSDDMQVKDAGN